MSTPSQGLRANPSYLDNLMVVGGRRLELGGHAPLYDYRDIPALVSILSQYIIILYNNNLTT